MTDNIRTESLLGNNKVIVGNKFNDIVLETLGKVYIKTGNNLQLLTEIISKINNSSQKNTIIKNNILQLEEMKYPGDGIFIFIQDTSTLYISYDGRYIKLIQVTEEENQEYVKKSGDTMSGPLTINTETAPLIVKSRELIKNLNAQYLNSYSVDDLAKNKEDELIYGTWTFKKPTTIEGQTTLKDNVIVHKSISSPQFLSGFGGNGWKLDANTNTLTIDNLVVRKVMQVYELVINQINATNGSLWVTNASTITEVEQPFIVTVNQLDFFEQEGWTGSEEQIQNFKRLFFQDKYYLITDDTLNEQLTINSDTIGPDSNQVSIGIVSESNSLSGPTTINKSTIEFVNYKYFIKIINIDGLLKSPLFTGKSSLLSEQKLTELSEFIQIYYINRKVSEQEGHIETFSKDSGFYAIVEETKIKIKPYYKYFGLHKETMQKVINEWITHFDSTHSSSNSFVVPQFWIITVDKYPYFKPGDIIRCQKYQDDIIKYYDAVILSQIKPTTYIIQKALNNFDQYTEIKYTQDGVQYINKFNDIIYSDQEKAYNPDTDKDVYLEGFESEEERLEKRSADPSIEDDLIQIGSISDTQRQNAVYITSVDNSGPYIDIISDVNRPDYSVIYNLPEFKRYQYVNTTVDNEYKGVIYNYYLLEPTEENSKIQGVVPIYKDKELIYYGTISPLDNSIIESDSTGKEISKYSTTTKVRLGNLDGIHNDIFKDKQPHGFGLYGENVFLTGEFYLNNGKSVAEFSPDGILLKFEEAGLSIIEEDGKSSIKMNADQFKIQLNSGEVISFFKNDKLDTSIFDVDGWIKANGLNINDNCIISKEGFITAKGAIIEGDITATKGTIGGFIITESSIGSQTESGGILNNSLVLTSKGIAFKTDRKQVGIGDTLPPSSGSTNLISGVFTVTLGQYDAHNNLGSVIIETKGGSNNTLYKQWQVGLKIITEAREKDVAIDFKGKLNCHGQELFGDPFTNYGITTGIGFASVWDEGTQEFKRANFYFANGLLTNIVFP